MALLHFSQIINQNTHYINKTSKILHTFNILKQTVLLTDNIKPKIIDHYKNCIYNF